MSQLDLVGRGLLTGCSSIHSCSWNCVDSQNHLPNILCQAQTTQTKVSESSGRQPGNFCIGPKNLQISFKLTQSMTQNSHQTKCKLTPKLTQIFPCATDRFWSFSLKWTSVCLSQSFWLVISQMVDGAAQSPRFHAGETYISQERYYAINVICVRVIRGWEKIGMG